MNNFRFRKEQNIFRVELYYPERGNIFECQFPC